MTDKRNLSAMVLHETICTLVGPIEPMGETNADARRIENIRVLTELVDMLLDDIQDVTRFVQRPEDSIRQIADHAAAFMNDMVQRH